MTVTIEFHGICTFVSQDTVPRLPAPWRAVLPNAAHGADIRGIPIQAHGGSIEFMIPGENLAPLALEGYRMYLTSPVVPAEKLVMKPDFFRLPDLTTLMRTIEPLGPPSPQMVLEGDPEIAAAYFDFTMGTVTAGLSALLAATTVLALENEVSLHIETFAGVAVREPIPLPSGSIVTIYNADADKTGATGADFLLHYLTAGQLPFVPQVPQSINLPFHDVSCTVGAGCSNSTYP